MLGSNLKEGKTVGPVAGQRSKISLPPGRSLMDWVRLGLSGKDLQGQGGQIRKISMEELSKHDKKDDCWMLLRGKVYNITPYMEFHPGGIPELMKAAGKDGTALFEEVHKWVNIESMLAKCFIGPIIEDSAKSNLNGNSSVSKLLGKPSPSLLLEEKSPKLNNKVSTPRYEWYQNENLVMVTIFTKDKNTTDDNLIIDCSNGKTLDCKVLFPESFYQIHIELEFEISNVKVKPAKNGSGKIEVILQKSEAERKWSTLGSKLNGNGELRVEKDRELLQRQCCVAAIEQVTSDTKLFSIQLPKLVKYKCPIGYHVLLEKEVHGIVVGKNYTVALDTLNNENTTKREEDSRLQLMIKIYKDGALTPFLDQLKIGDMITVSDCIGNFKMSRLHAAKSIYMISAGTGLTPMIRIMDFIVRDKETHRSSHLLFANRHESDILWRAELDQFAATHPDLIDVKYILSRPPADWTGLCGRITKEILADFIGSVEKPSIDDELLICICGSDEFTNLINGYLISMNFKESTIHSFLG